MEKAIQGVVTGKYQWIVFTSSNAVRAVRERLEDYGLMPARWPASSWRL